MLSHNSTKIASVFMHFMYYIKTACSIAIWCYITENEFTQRVHKVLFNDDKNSYHNTEGPYTFSIGHNSTDIASVLMQVVGPFTRVHMGHGGFSLIVPGPLYHNTVVAESAN